MIQTDKPFEIAVLKINVIFKNKSPDIILTTYIVGRVTNPYIYLPTFLIH